MIFVHLWLARREFRKPVTPSSANLKVFQCIGCLAAADDLLTMASYNEVFRVLSCEISI